MRIGDYSSIYHFARIETFDLSDEYDEKIMIGNHVDIQQNVHITSGSRIEIGNGTLILPNVLITDIVHPYYDVHISPLNQKLETYAVSIGANCQIGMGARILPGITIGDGCIIGTNAVVTHSIPKYSVAVGIPAKVIKKYDFQENEWKPVQ